MTSRFERNLLQFRPVADTRNVPTTILVGWVGGLLGGALTVFLSAPGRTVTMEVLLAATGFGACLGLARAFMRWGYRL